MITVGALVVSWTVMRTGKASYLAKVCRIMATIRRTELSFLSCINTNKTRGLKVDPSKHKKFTSHQAQPS